jgi:hypothetical protein
MNDIVDFLVGILQRLGLTGWPLVVIVFVLLFRKPIAAWIPSIRRVGPGGVEAGPPPTQDGLKSPATETEREPGRASEELMRALDPPLLVDQEKRILQDLQSRGLGQPNQETLRVLVRYLATFQFGYLFENIYRDIYGSQLALLQYLNTLPNAPVSAAQHYYDQAASRYPDVFRTYPFDSYLNWLASVANVVSKTDGQISITPLGREFLAYLTRSGRFLNKPF